MFIDYSKYSTEELFDVYSNIDKENYPERFQALCDEIEKRKKTEQFKTVHKAIEEDKYADYEGYELGFAIEFSSEGSGAYRKLFIGIFFLINIITLGLVINKYTVSSLSNIHQYNTQIQSAVCKVETIKDEKGYIQTYYDLRINSYQDTFLALGINKNKCENIARTLRSDLEISIWHKDGLIYQLKSNNVELLRYNYMKLKVRAMQTYDVYLYFLGLLFLWGIFYRSLVNAFSPGTYTST
ncbi:hypothetical protein D5018_14480 [Parashewanella curva]|uniref:Uncharacterized protein n=1 Tax=Parashewanella curva TaxID=2338552 RepID=A0A3L8PU85_9GAMM|nr:hypothetical protein [Parashewanella curva]RLV58977.1 hypothetical protein D5018_14480 [Parashewanella curva]